MQRFYTVYHSAEKEMKLWSHKYEVTILHNMNFMKPELDPDGESYQSYHNENQLIDTEEDKGPIIIKFPVMNSEYEVSYMSDCPLLICVIKIFQNFK